MVGKSRGYFRSSTGRSSVEQRGIRCYDSRIQGVVAYAQFIQESSRVRFGGVAFSELSNFIGC